MTWISSNIYNPFSAQIKTSINNSAVWRCTPFKITYIQSWRLCETNLWLWALWLQLELHDSINRMQFHSNVMPLKFIRRHNQMVPGKLKSASQPIFCIIIPDHKVLQSHWPQCMIKIFRGQGWWHLQNPVLRCFWKDPLMTPQPLHPPPHFKHLSLLTPPHPPPLPPPPPP